MTHRFLRPLFLLLLAASCASPSAVEIRTRALLQTAENRMQRAAISIRYNPVDCDCPAFEVQLDGRWIRADVVESKNPVQVLETFRQLFRSQTTTNTSYREALWLELETDKVFSCPNGTPYLQVVLLPPQEPEA